MIGPMMTSSMKQSTILSVAAVAVVALFSCSKDNQNNDNLASKGTYVSFTVDDPVVSDDSEGTKMSISGTGASRTLNWTDGDAFNMWSFGTEANQCTSWGSFSKDGDTFSGYVPDGYLGTTYVGVYSPCNSFNAADVYWNSGSSRYDLKFHIPATQDGTGLRYCLFVAWPSVWTSAGKYVISYSSSYTNQKFSLKSTLSCLTIGSTDSPVTSISVRVTSTKNYPKLVSASDSKDCTYNVTGKFYGSGGSNDTVTITNGGSELPSTVYFVTRPLSNGTFGNITLHFTFNKENGTSVKKKVYLGDGNGFNGGTLYNFGSIDLS